MESNDTTISVENLYTDIMKVIGAKWSSAIILEISKDNIRFSTIQKALPGITKKSLSRELRKLEDFQILIRTIEETPTQQIRYHLSTAGKELVPAIHTIHNWIDRNYSK